MAFGRHVAARQGSTDSRDIRAAGGFLMPNPPKPAALRSRRNKTSTAATLPTQASMVDAIVPDLPGRTDGWHPLTLEWWADLWRSPMASEYLNIDTHRLYMLAALVNDFWTATNVTGRLAALTEIRLTGQLFGLTPIDRARLHWEIDKGDQAEERASRRKAVQKTAGKDPRDALKIV